MNDIVARYTLKFNDLASKGLLRAAGAARAFSLAGTAAIAGIGALTAGVIALSKASFGLAAEWADTYDALDETAQMAGVSATYLRNLTMALSDMGVEQGVANKGAIKFNQNLGKFRASGLTKALSDISGDFGFLTDKTLSTEKALQKTLETIAAIPDSAKRTAALGEIFGRAGVMMGAAVADIDALNAGMKIYNDILGEITDKQLKDASDYSSALLQAGAAWKAIKLAVGQVAAPLFLPMIQNFVKFLAENRDQITAGFTEAFEKLGAAMAQIDWTAVLTSMTKLIGYIPVLVEAFTWLIDNIGTVATVIGTVKVAGLLSQFNLLLPILGGLRTGFTLLGGVLKYLPGLIRVVALAFGPVGLAITAVVAAGYLLYKNWDLVKAGATALWGAITSAWNGIDNATGGFLSRMIAVAQSILGVVFAPIRAGIALLKGDFGGALKIMQSAWGAAWNAMGNVLSGIWSGIKNVVATGVNFLIDKINGLLQKWNAVAPSFMAASPIPRMAAATAPAVASTATRQRVAVDINLSGQVKGADVRPNVTTSQGAKYRGGNNHPAGGRK